MRQLTGLDSSFLAMETASTFGHVSSLIVYKPPANRDFNPYESYKKQLAARLDQLEPLRRRLVEVPFGLDHPYWINDPDFDVDFHVRHIAVPPPGRHDQLGDLVARLVARPLDRSKPLWEVYVIEGLDDGNFAIVTKMHHAAVDGAAGSELTMMMLDATPDGEEEPKRPITWRAETEPSAGELLARTSVEMMLRPRKIAKVQVQVAREIARQTNIPAFNTVADLIRKGFPGMAPPARAERQDELPPVPTSPAPGTPFNKSITATRSFSYRSMELQTVKDIKNALGCTLNDVVMALCAGGLRRYLEHHNALPEDPLVAMVPVSIRTGEEEHRWTNRVSAIFTTIPTNLADPLERVGAINASMNSAKKQHDLLPAEMVLDIAQLAPPALAARASKLASRFKVADRVNSPVNIVISNVPGPRSPLYFDGAQMMHFYPVSIVTDGQGLNITVQSYCDQLDVGLIAARNLVPDLEFLMDCLADETRELISMLGLETQQPAAKAPPAKKTIAKKTTAKKATATKTTAKKTATKKATAKKPRKKAAPKVKAGINE